MNFKRIISMTLVVLLAMGCLFAMGGCKKKAEKPQPQAVYNDTAHEVGYQLEMPEKGEKIAIIHTTEGDITLRFFPEAAPKAVENFLALAESGTYDGTIFHRVIADFMIQTGDYENGDGTGGSSTFDEAFADEFSNKLFNIRGAVSMANAGVNTNGSQFFINTAKAASFDETAYDYDTFYNEYSDIYDEYKKSYGYEFYREYKDVDTFISDYIGGIYPLSYAVSEAVWNLYKENGGNISLDGAFRQSGGHTVFAQVIAGMDVVDKIENVETDENDKPVQDIKIVSIEITEYKG